MHPGAADRLARSVAHLTQIVHQLEDKGVSLKIIGMGLDTSTPNGKLMLNVLGAVAQFEREVMLERQREGIAKAKEKASTRGAPQQPAPNPARSSHWRRRACRKSESRKRSESASPRYIAPCTLLSTPWLPNGAPAI